MPEPRLQTLLVGCSIAAAAGAGRALPDTVAARLDGIVAFAIDHATGRLGEISATTPWRPTSYAAFDAPRRRLFVLSQTPLDEPTLVGSFAVGDNGRLTFINEESTNGREGCHLTADPAGRFVISAHFSSASYSVHPVGPDGRLQSLSQLLQVTGSGPHPRQDVPHPHMVVSSPDGRWLITVDMGSDEVGCLTLDAKRGAIVPHQVPAARVQPGGGARHLVVHPSNRIFVCNELDSSVTTLTLDAELGRIAYRAHATTLLDPARQGPAVCGAIRLSPDGRFLYIANRGRQTFAIFRVEAEGLAAIGEVACPGDGARDMSVTDKAIYVAFTRSDKVCVFPRDAESGGVGPAMQTIPLPSAMFVLPITQ